VTVEKRYRTKSGTVLTEADLQRLVDEAEAGYCTAIVETEDFRARCFRPMPCPIHPIHPIHVIHAEAQR
jgi:hypothetical protein